MAAAGQPISNKRVPTILVVEDDTDTQQFLIDLLTAEGYHVLTAASGEEALAMMEATAVDGVTLDLHLPDMDGYTVCRHIRRSQEGDVPILVVSANRTSQHQAMACVAGATDYLAKPFPPNALLSRLAMLLRE
ncbi:MAG TPA: response regulator transcription factor [Herpetosiphonaceae bacterium]|nr:response regulator transcription factor [Herpetosiphonaceae bacterium]